MKNNQYILSSRLIQYIRIAESDVKYGKLKKYKTLKDLFKSLFI
jgi:hypothetical protein